MDLCSFEIYSGNAVEDELNECQDLHVEITTRVRIFLLRGRVTRVLETTLVIPMKVKSLLRHYRDHPLLVHVKLYVFLIFSCIVIRRKHNSNIFYSFSCV